MRRCVILSIAVSGDSRVASKENEKLQKYQDLSGETSQGDATGRSFT